MWALEECKSMMTKNLRRIEPTEHQIVSGVMDFASKVIVKVPVNKNVLLDSLSVGGQHIYYMYSHLPLSRFFVKITNEGKRSYGHIKYLKKEGFNKGVSDSLLAYPICNKGKIGLWMEAKSKGGKLTKEQEDWINLMRWIGFDAVVYRSVDEGIQAIKDYLGMK